MSGGSFNYVCYKDVDDLMNSQEDLEDMRKALISTDMRILQRTRKG